MSEIELELQRQIIDLRNQIDVLKMIQVKNSIYGWLRDSDTWVYVSATQFKITGKDVTARFPVGTKIKLTQTTTKYFYVVATAFSTDTTVTITGGSDYNLANAAITDPCYSYVETPQGFPGYFNWVPTLTGFSVNPSGVYRFSMSGKKVNGYVTQNADGTSNAITFSISLPFTIAIGGQPVGSIRFWDGGAPSATLGICEVTTTVFNLYTSGAGAGWSTTGYKAAHFNFSMYASL